jgi:hypothetical protein
MCGLSNYVSMNATKDGCTGLRAFHANFQTNLSIGCRICGEAASSVQPAEPAFGRRRQVFD